MSSYKEDHQNFVSGHNGTTVIEIASVVSTAPVAVFIQHLMCLWLFGPRRKPNVWFKLTLDFVTLIVPVILAFTVLANDIDTLYTILFVIIASFVILNMAVSMNYSNMSLSETVSNLMALPMEGKRPFITYFRAYVNIATAIAILAVDFVVFPRRFAKAETYGTGLMDVGVGAFIVSNAIVSPEARGKHIVERSFSISLKKIWKSILSTGPLWVIGLIRLAAVKSTDYQEHVTEYGVHWNFFFTLAVVRVISTAILCCFRPEHSWIIAVTMAVTYQYVLSVLGLSSYIINGTDGEGGRHNLLDANREGISSCFGYLSIYFVGVQLGMYLFKKRQKLIDWLWAAIVLIVIDGLAWYSLVLCEMHIQQTSRRMANLGFIIWMIGYNLQLLTSFMLVDILSVMMDKVVAPVSVNAKKDGDCERARPISVCLLEAINSNGLFFFLLANLFTGCVNFSIRTIDTEPRTAFIILVGYMFTLCNFVFCLQIKNISLKFW